MLVFTTGHAILCNEFNVIYLSMGFQFTTNVTSLFITLVWAYFDWRLIVSRFYEPFFGRCVPFVIKCHPNAPNTRTHTQRCPLRNSIESIQPPLQNEWINFCHPMLQRIIRQMHFNFYLLAKCITFCVCIDKMCSKPNVDVWWQWGVYLITHRCILHMPKLFSWYFVRLGNLSMGFSWI